jgi:hypothetical protein
MVERSTTVEQVSRKPVYTQAVILQGGGRPAEAASTSLRQRTVATSQTDGTVNLRYAPRQPKASQPVDTAS